MLPLRRAQRSPQITPPLQVSRGLHLLGHTGEQLDSSAGTRPHPTPPLALFPQLHSHPDARALTEHPFPNLHRAFFGFYFIWHRAFWLYHHLHFLSYKTAALLFAVAYVLPVVFRPQVA